MKYLLVLIILTAAISDTNAQTTTGQKKTQITKQEKKRIKRGTGQYYGSKDTTPGSPMGTGGAGGDMSGSPQASANETHEDAEIKSDSSDNGQGTANMNGTTQKRPVNKKTKSPHRKSRNY